MADLSCGNCFGRAFLIALNIIFFLLGLGLLVGGLILKFGTDLFGDHVTKVLKEIPAKDIVGNLNFHELLNSLTIVIIVIGVVIFVIGALGCCGACCKIRWMLILYGILVMLILIAQVVGVALFLTMKTKLDNIIKKGMNDLLPNYQYDSNLQPDSNLTGDAILSRALDVMFIKFKCCGVNNSTDLTSSTSFNPARGEIIPVSCCNAAKLPYEEMDFAAVDACIKTPTKDNSFMERGCYAALWEFIDQYSNIFIGVGVAVLVVELLCVICAFCLCHEIKKKK